VILEPPVYGSKSTVHGRFQQWVEHGVFDEVLAVLPGVVNERGRMELPFCFIDGTFVPTKNRHNRAEPTKTRDGGKLRCYIDVGK